MRRSAAKRSLHVRLHHVLEVDHAEDAAAFDEAQRRAARARDLVDGGTERRRLSDILPGLLARELEDGIDSALAQLALADVDAGQPRRCGKLDESARRRRRLPAHVIFVLHQRDDGAAFGGLIRVAGQAARLPRPHAR